MKKTLTTAIILISTSGLFAQVDSVRVKTLKAIDLKGAYKYNTEEASASLKLETPLQKLPQNIQVVNSQLISDQQIMDLFGGIERNVSGVRRSVHQETYASINIRGFMTRGSSSSFRNGLSTSGYFGPLKEDASYVERVEFIKGPGGFMLANGEPGGFYNVVTKKPQGIKQNKLVLTTGSFGTYRAEMDNQGKISDKVWFRLNTMGQKKGSHIDYQYNNAYAIAPVISYMPDDRTRLTLEFNHQHSDFGAFNAYVYSFKGFKDAPRNRSYVDPSTDPVRVTDNNAFINFTKQLNNNWKLTSQAAYLQSKMRGEYLAPVYNGLQPNGDVDRSFSLLDVDNYSALVQAFLNGNFVTGAISHKVLAGVDAGRKQYYADWSDISDPAYTTPYNINRPGDFLLSADQIPKVDRSVDLKTRAPYKGDNRYAAGYIQDEIGLMDDRLRITLAGRFTQTQRRDYKNEGFINNNVFTPRAGLSFSFADNSSVYALYDQSFTENYGRPLKNGEELKPSRGNNIEAGLKSELIKDRLTATVSVYQITKTNLTSTAGPINNQYSIQTGEAQSKGVEFDLQGELFPSFNMMVNYAYTDAKVTKDEDPSRVGHLLPGSAKHIANSWLSYRFDERSPIRGFGLAAGFRWQKDRVTYPFGEGVLPDDYFSLDASVSYKFKGVEIALLIDNITDNYNYNGAFPGAWGYTHYLWQADPPTNYRLRLGYSF